MRVYQWPIDGRLRVLEDRLSKKFEEVEVDLLRVRIFFLVDAHKQVLNVDNDAQQPVKFGVVDSLKDEHIVTKVFKIMINKL
jgi:hypothetical protein